VRGGDPAGVENIGRDELASEPGSHGVTLHDMDDAIAAGAAEGSAPTVGELFGRLVDRAVGPRGARPEDRKAFLALFGDGSNEKQREAVAAALGGLHAWIAVLDLASKALLGNASAIEPAPGEVDPEIDLDRMDRPTEVRSVLRNVAESHLRPAIEDLRALLAEKP
jgi:hypothetical protein